MNPMVKLAAISIIPKLINDAYTYLKDAFTNPISIEVKPVKKRKKSDCSPWTKQRFDIVMNKRNTWIEYNEDPSYGRIPLSTLIKDINHTLDMNKSRRAIAAIWEGKIKREDLPNDKPRS